RSAFRIVFDEDDQDQRCQQQQGCRQNEDAPPKRKGARAQALTCTMYPTPRTVLISTFDASSFLRRREMCSSSALTETCSSKLKSWFISRSLATTFPAFTTRISSSRNSRRPSSSALPETLAFSPARSSSRLPTETVLDVCPPVR